MGIAGMDATDQRIKVVFNLFAGVDDDPAARDHKIDLLLELVPSLFQDCSRQAQGRAVTPLSNDGFQGFRLLASVYIVDTMERARKFGGPCRSAWRLSLS